MNGKIKKFSKEMRKERMHSLLWYLEEEVYELSTRDFDGSNKGKHEKLSSIFSSIQRIQGYIDEL